MKYSYAAAALAMATGVLAKPVVTNGDSIKPEEGKPFTLELEGCEATCTVYLMQGPKDAQTPFRILDSTFFFSRLAVAQLIQRMAHARACE